jgi:ubiquinone/menaquinone biosynthesis C-methylase UbiE
MDGWGTAGRVSGNFERTMSEPRGKQSPPPERSFGPVADAYDRARPSYPEEAVGWLTGAGRSVVLDLGAGTGKLTSLLHDAGHDVLAVDPLPEMLAHLSRRVPVQPVAATAEQLPLRSRSVDLVVCGQSFHWFDHDRALPEIARVLRPGGMLALAFNTYDVSIPWVRRLKALISPQSGSGDEAAEPLMETPYFGFVDKKQFRNWSTHTAASLADLTRSLSHVATMGEPERARVLAKVDALYAEYGRGHDGMQLPYVTRCYRAVVRHQELPPEVPLPARRQPAAPTADPAEDGPTDAPTAPTRKPPEDPGTQLIDFR